MTALTIPPADRPLLRRALQDGVRVLEQLAPDVYAVSSRSHPTTPRRVDLADGTCTCPLNVLGYTRCPHLATAAVFASWLRSQAVA